MKKHIELFPMIELHYLGKQTTRTYNSENLNVAKMYRMNVEYHKELNIQNWAYLSMYQHIFNYNFNFSFLYQKKIYVVLVNHTKIQKIKQMK